MATQTIQRKPEAQIKLPSDILLEQHVLACIILSGEIGEAAQLLSDDSFFDYFNRQVWQAVNNLSADGSAIDVMTVMNELSRLGNEDTDRYIRICQMVEAAGSGSNMQYYSMILQQKYIQRQLVVLGQKTAVRGSDNTEDVADIIESLMNAVESLNNITYKTVITFDEAMRQAVSEMKLAAENANLTGMPGIATGVSSYDKYFGGLQPELHIIAGRPGMGKTSYALSLAYDIARQGKPVMFFSLEMSAASLAKKVMSFHTGVALEKFVKGTLDANDWQVFDNGVSAMSKMPLYFDETAGIKLHELRSRAKSAKDKYGIQAIFIDYLQLIEVTVVNKIVTRDQVVGDISRTLKKISKELALPVVCLSQLSREVEKRGDKRPQLSDLRESGSIEQDADVIQFVYRPEYYNIPEVDGMSTTSDAEIIVAKNRNGHTGSFHLNFVASQTLFKEWDSFVQPVPSF